jgi:3-oxoacyl-[acyl-carrier protein] reductase
MKLQDRVGIVTGSSSGIGAACAIALAKRGCRTVINYSKSRDAAEEVAAQCRSHGADSLVVQANVALDADCKRLAAAAMERWQRIDALVNNAGTTKFAAHHDLQALQADDFHSIYATNVVGAFQMVRAVAPAMRQQGAGSVVNMASIAAVTGNGSSVAYAASKGALNTMTLSLARALGPQIRVNAVCPGFVATKWLQQGLGAERYEQAKTDYQQRVPLQRVVTPEDIASAVVWLIEGAESVTGESIIIDGGSHLGGAPLKAR